KFGVFAQNRWAPIGASVRTEPNVLAAKIEPGFAGNEIVAVNGWVHGQPFPNPTEPWNSDVWFHLANRTGWVAYAAVRAVPTDPDPTLRADGGIPAPTTPECEGTYKK
ncbi:MAG TPA: hypothetical protein VLE74_04150, partial [Candidatus Saccharimonadales bacterium]|nr:hypothetical protein [Candidatus Saccharimonadales bacterium]